MRAERLSVGACKVEPFDIAGTDSATSTNFIGHVGFFAANYTLTSCGHIVRLLHMQPPFDMGRVDVPAHAAGILELSEPQRKMLRVFADELENEYELSS